MKLTAIKQIKSNHKKKKEKNYTQKKCSGMQTKHRVSGHGQIWTGPRRGLDFCRFVYVAETIQDFLLKGQTRLSKSGPVRFVMIWP